MDLPPATHRRREIFVWLLHSWESDWCQSGWRSWGRVISIVWPILLKVLLTFQSVSWSASILANVADFFPRISSFKLSTVRVSSMETENDRSDTPRIQQKIGMVRTIVNTWTTLALPPVRQPNNVTWHVATSFAVAWLEVAWRLSRLDLKN